MNPSSGLLMLLHRVLSRNYLEEDAIPFTVARAVGE